VVGNVEAQFAFSFDAKVPKGQARDHRVDAFFRIGDIYTPSVSVDESKVTVVAPIDFGADWSLTGTRLARFSGGQFVKQYQMLSQAPGSPGQFTATRRDAFETFGYTEGTHLDTALKADNRAWTWYDFKSKSTGATLTIAKPLAE
jgi:hypothetical protein